MKFLAWFNVLGILALTVLLAFQWQANRNVSLLAVSLDKVRQEHEKKITEQEHTITGLKKDLDDFRDRLERSDAALNTAQGEIVSLRSERDRLTTARDQALSERTAATEALKQSQETLAKWVAAVKERDESLKKAIAEINDLAKARNDAIAKFNDLAGKYNALVKEASKPAPAR